MSAEYMNCNVKIIILKNSANAQYKLPDSSYAVWSFLGQSHTETKHLTKTMMYYTT